MSTALRTLLIDCRIALRTQRTPEEADALAVRLEAAIQDITKGMVQAASASTATKTTASQVALAWQTATRGLKLTHPELYGALNEKVMNLVNSRELVDPVNELLQLEEQVKQLEKDRVLLASKSTELRGKLTRAQAELDELHKALAGAAPQVIGGENAQDLALRRLDALVLEGQMPSSSGSHGGNGQSSSKKAPEVEGPIPTKAILEQVVAGQRAFSKEQRDWVVGEAFGLSGWEFTPVELLGKGEPWLAQLLLEKGTGFN